MTSGAHTRKGRLGLPWCSSGLPGILGTEVDDAREGSWSQCYEVLVLLGR
jgi:hypothetical protein